MLKGMGGLQKIDVEGQTPQFLHEWGRVIHDELRSNGSPKAEGGKQKAEKGNSTFLMINSLYLPDYPMRVRT